MIYTLSVWHYYEAIQKVWNEFALTKKLSKRKLKKKPWQLGLPYTSDA